MLIDTNKHSCNLWWENANWMTTYFWKTAMFCDREKLDNFFILNDSKHKLCDHSFFKTNVIKIQVSCFYRNGKYWTGLKKDQWQSTGEDALWTNWGAGKIISVVWWHDIVIYFIFAFANIIAQTLLCQWLIHYTTQYTYVVMSAEATHYYI